MVIASHSRLFWRTLLLTTIIFVIGIFVGKSVVELRSDEVFDVTAERTDTQATDDGIC